MSTSPEQPIFINATDLAARLGISRTTLRRWVQQGAIPRAIEIAPRVHRFYLADVMDKVTSMRRAQGEAK